MGAEKSQQKETESLWDRIINVLSALCVDKGNLRNLLVKVGNEFCLLIPSSNVLAIAGLNLVYTPGNE